MTGTLRIGTFLPIFVAVIASVAMASIHRTASAADQTVQWSLPAGSAVTINVGDTVTWEWADALPHTVTSTGGPAAFDSGVLTGNGQSFAFTFTQAGTYTYTCGVHPGVMSGTVQVQGAQASPSNTPTATATNTTAAPTSTPTPTTAAAPTSTPTATATGTTPATATASPTAVATATSTPTQPPAATATSTQPPPTLAGAKTISLTGAEEVPPVTTDATGSFQYRLDGQSLAWVLKASGNGITMAHIHLGDKGANGPVVAFLFGPNQVGVTSLDLFGTVTAADLIGPLAGDMPGFISAFSRGGLYVNVHSIANPAGVTRGQIPATAAPGVPSTGTGTAGEDGSATTTVAIAILSTIVILGGSAMLVLNRRRGTSSR